uniref:NADH-ubiquinone oxidoreductase chain 2 n=1 Tax=Staphylinoidea sp. 9 KM-2017 TaxID=2219463 RepID=A0A346RGD5_9COLE|nr:NADH dehydrogenase subunit 2 [Staphylinoidea sp. 9 KM-2017]
MKIYKITFFFILIMSIFIVISSSSWFSMWIGLEINLLTIIPLMVNKKFLMSEASLKYFITQAFSSSLVLIFIILSSKMNLSYYLLTMMLNSALLTKMGAAPFHFWFPEIMEGLMWMPCLILLTIQKIPPMIMIFYTKFNMIFISTIILMSMMVGGIMGLNQISLRKIMAYSSINHIGWMIASIFYSMKIWMIYFSIYTIISLNLILLFENFKIYFIAQLNILFSQNFSMKIIMIFNFMSLGGLPPFIGFFPKWLVIQSLIYQNLFTISIIMVMLTLVTLFYYMRLSFTFLMLNSPQIKFFKSTKFNHLMIFNFNMFSIFSLIICTLFFNLS